MERCRQGLVGWLRRLLSADQIVDTHKRRRTLLLGAILLIALSFTLSLLVIRIFTEFIVHDDASQIGFDVFFIVISALLLGIYLLRRGLVQVVAFALLSLFLLCCLHGSFTWGIDLYTINIIYPLLILLAAVLFGRRFAFLMLFTVMLSLSVIFFLHDQEIVAVSREWRLGGPDIFNLLTIVLAYLFMSLVAWLTVREIERALLAEQALNAKLRTALNQLLSVSTFVEMGKLSAGLLHDLKQPLSVLHILAKDAHDEQLQNSLAEIDDLLVLNQSQRVQRPHFELFSLHAEANRIISLFKYKLAEQGAKVILQSKADFDLYADRQVFHKVLTNLLMNAIEALQPETTNRHILISWARNRLGLKITVKDFGVGMTIEQQQQLFTPRFSAKDSLGLGLYLSNEAMRRAYQTKISFRSEFGFGSSFTIHIKNRYLYEDNRAR